MSDNNGWTGKPGVPLNPEQSGWHRIQEPGEDPEYAFWRAKPFLGDGRGCWETKGTDDDWEPHEISDWRYLRPCSLEDLSPAEVDARIADAQKQWLAELDHDTDALMESARQSALAECIAACDAVIRLYRVELPEKYKFKPEGIPFEWEQTWEGWAEIAEDIAAAIRALSDTPPGMVLVPREPTEAMIKACLQAALDFMAETKTTEIHPGQTYPSPSENARRCWRAMVKAAGKGEGDE
jgi:hypothetical protein